MTLQSHSWAYLSGEKQGLRGYMHPNVHCSTICINRGMDKEGVVHQYNGILLSHQKE